MGDYKNYTFVIKEEMLSEFASRIFCQSVLEYHRLDDVNQFLQNPFEEGTWEALLYKKNWVDTVQWHYEDIIRDPNIHPQRALELKRKIDNSNQLRTDLVEKMDDYFLHKYKNVKPLSMATINTESPAWALDRLSILELKIFHMQQETQRKDVDLIHTKKCAQKLDILKEQKADLSIAIDQLLDDISKGKKYMKVYRQMKMYNDETLNPILYKNKK